MAPPIAEADVAALRALLAARPERPSDVLVEHDIATSADTLDADDVWTSPPFAPIALRPPVAWDAVASENRSWDYRLQAFEFLTPLLAARATDPSALARAVALVTDWLDAEQRGEASGFAWYDMAVGLRSVRLAELLAAVLRDDAADEATCARLLALVRRHVDWLADAENFPGHSNHGAYVALGLAATLHRLAGVAELDALRPLADAIVEGILDVQFAPDGGHLEHSPGYHADVALALREALASGVVASAHLAELSARADAALAWLVAPDGQLVTIGDTIAAPPAVGPAAPHPPLAWVRSRGAEGCAPAGRIATFADGGFVAMRSHWRYAGAVSTAAHLVQTCAVHSDVHRHDDLLAFTWHDRGQRVAIDPGRWGYEYEDPRRRYVVSCRAHSTVELDGEPEHGSALRACGELGDCLWSDCVSTRAGRVHRRLLLMAPGRWLLVADRVDGTPQDAPPLQRLQLAPELAVGVHEGAVRLGCPSGDVLYATGLGEIALEGVVAGVSEPRPQGWSSPTLLDWLPAASAGWRAQGSGPWVLATLLSWDRPAEDTRAHASGDAGLGVGWRLAGERADVRLGPDGPSLTTRATPDAG